MAHGLQDSAVDKLKELVKCSRQIEQNTRSEQTCVTYKTRKELGVHKVNAKVRAVIYAITDIDNEKQEFTARLKITIRWKEPLLAGRHVGDEIDWDDQWSPRIELENAIKTRNLDRKFCLRYFDRDGIDGIPHVCLEMSVSATFKEMFELDEFPFDYQALNIWLVSEWPHDQVEMVNDPDYMDHISVNTFTESEEWKLSPHLMSSPAGVPEPSHEVIGSTACYSLYSITAHVSRIPYYYVSHHLVPMFLIHWLSFCAFAISPSPENTASRLGVSILALILTLTLRFTLQKGLPNIAYMSIYDKYYLFLLVSHVLITVELAVIGKLSQFLTLGRTEVIDYAMVLITIVLSIAVQCYLIGTAYQMYNKRKKYLQGESYHFLETCERIWKRFKTFNEKNVAPRPGSERPGSEQSHDYSSDQTTLSMMPVLGADLVNPSVSTYEVKFKAKSKHRRNSRNLVKPVPLPEDTDLVNTGE